MGNRENFRRCMGFKKVPISCMTVARLVSKSQHYADLSARYGGILTGRTKGQGKYEAPICGSLDF